MLRILFFTLAGLLSIPANFTSAQIPQPEDVIPSVDELASEWLDPQNLVQMPSLHNFHEMAACAPTLLGINYYPGGQLFGWPVTGRWYNYNTLPVLELKINGEKIPSSRCRWYPYQAVRQATVNGVEIQTSVRMVFEGPGLLYKIDFQNAGAEQQNLDVKISLPGKLASTEDAQQWSFVRYQSESPALTQEHAVPHSGKLTEAEDGTLASWNLLIQPGKKDSIQLAMGHSLEDDTEEAPSAHSRALAYATRFESTWQETKTKWAERWLQSFQPGNTFFSGNVPLLVADDQKIRDIYYRSILTLLVLHRTNLKMCDRVFITSGERDKGFVFYWDTSMWSKIFALWEPRAMKEQLRMFFQADPHGGFVFNMETGKQGDGWYAANDMTMFRLANSYLAVTGDRKFLHEVVGDRTVLEHLEKLATGWRELQRDKSLMLADYGENENLLECAPMYVHRVPSFNAANVWMMRIVANYYESEGNEEKAGQLRDWANQIADAVLKLYKPQDGVWYALHRDGTKVELRHCYDFVCIGEFMTPDLSGTVKQEMVDFVERELLTDRWMRAMSPLDKAAAISDRPDHGPLGAFDAWPALTANTMCQLGAWKEAVEFLRSTQQVLDEGVYGQAREFYGPRKYEKDAPVRIALRGACMRECVGGGAFAEMILESLFGFSPAFGKELELRATHQDRYFAGTLYNVRYGGELLDLQVDRTGVNVKAVR